MKHELYELRQKQAMPLEAKVRMTKARIEEWYRYWDDKAYVSFSGGKDSTVLLDIARSLYPDIPAVFLDTGLEYPEVREFVKTIPGVEWVKPKLSFRQVLDKHGYPVVSKDTSQKVCEVREGSANLKAYRLGGAPNPRSWLPKKWRFLIDAPFRVSEMCCDELKKRPVKAYERRTGNKPIVGTMASDSRLRETNYLRHGCSNFDSKLRPMSAPMSFWLEADVWEYIHTHSLAYSSIYDMGYARTGCMFCTFGVLHDGTPNRFQRMSVTHPKLYEYCMNDLGLAEVLDYIHVPYK